ncbi:MAG: FIST N-terminal domain-containing protein, partial [Roseiflexaceae bacterium]
CYDYAELLQAITSSCQPRIMIGCSSAGEFTSAVPQEGSTCALALRSTEIHFAAGIGRNLRSNPSAAVQELTASFEGTAAHDYVYHSALVLTDALAGQTDQFIEQLTLRTAGVYQFFGGGAGDDARFQHTHVFCGMQAVSDAVVALEILSNKPLGIGVCHGWQPASTAMRVTDSEGMCLIGVNAIPAVEIFEEHAETTKQRFDLADPLPFFLHNVIGIDSGDGYKLRVPLGVDADGSIPCAADIPVGSSIQIMRTTGASALEAAASATSTAMQQLNGHRPKVALFFDCVATRLRLGNAFGLELQAIEQILGSAQYVGFNTYGQIARVDGQFSGFHNCTAVVCIFPE